jgi:hypothetical protein
MFKTCGNCDAPLKTKRAKRTGFCSTHCKNQHNGEECNSQAHCKYCKDNKLQ